MLLVEEYPPSNRFASIYFCHCNAFISSHSLQTIIWSLIEHFSRLLSENFSRSQLILEIFLQLKPPSIQPTYEQILQLADSLTDVHMKMIEDKQENLFDDLLLWRDVLRNLIQMNNPDFHLFLLITLIDFLVPKLNVRQLRNSPSFVQGISSSLSIKSMIIMQHVDPLIRPLLFSNKILQ